MMKRKKYILSLLLCLFFTACQTDPGTVNSDYQIPILTGVANPYGPNGAEQQYLNKKPSAAISGKLYLKSTISQLLINKQLDLYIENLGDQKRNNADQWKKIDSVMSNQLGEFYFIKKLFPGHYRIKIADSAKYNGELDVQLEQKTIDSIIFEVTAVENKKPQ
jgi:hypothetical protein